MALEMIASLDLGVVTRLGIEPGWVSSFAGTLTGFLFAFLAFALIYRVTPYLETRWRQVPLGAIRGAEYNIGRRRERLAAADKAPEGPE